MTCYSSLTRICLRSRLEFLAVYTALVFLRRMLKPTVNKDCCWHNVSQYATKRRDRQALPGQAGNSSGSNIAESHTDCDSLVGFGDAYYKRLSQLIDKHLELDTDDVVCYVGDDQGGQVVPVIAERYCIVRPVVRVNPHHVRLL